MREVSFKCRCSEERIGEMLMLLGTEELDELIAEDKPAEITCNYCNTIYTVPRPELERLRAQVKPFQSN
jgi:molecular chaperone Hsp33